MIPMRYELNSYILFRRNLVFEGSNAEYMPTNVENTIEINLKIY
jgi:hypothetical protein